MALLCGDTGQTIMFEDGRLYAVKLADDGDRFIALSAASFDRIPEGFRSQHRCGGQGYRGIHVYLAESPESLGGAYSWIHFKATEFMFSVASYAVCDYLPGIARKLRMTQAA